MQNVPQNKIEVIERQLIKVNRYLKRRFVTQEAFEAELNSKVATDPNGNLSVEEFKNFLLSTCSTELYDRKLSKVDLEGFLSAFVYNTHGGTDVSKVGSLVFEEDPTKLNLKLSIRTRPPVPPTFVNDDLASTQPLDFKDGTNAKRLRDLLSEIEDKSFAGKPKLFEVFRRYD